MKIAITGPESSGKSTLAQLLASKFKGKLIPEYAREYLEKSQGKYSIIDLDQIALGQIKMWKENEDSNLIFCDTEMLVMKIWSEYKYNTCSELILNQLEKQNFDHYFLCSPDIPWEEDPLREHSNERESLFKIYINELKFNKLPFTIVSGNLENRLKTCEEVIQRLSLQRL